MSEVVTLHYGKALLASSRQPGTIPVYGTNGQTGWHNKALANGPTVVLGRKGMGNLGVEWCPGPLWVIDTAYYSTFDASRLMPKFFYYFQSYVGLNHLKDGTSNPSLSRSTFACQLLPLPPLDEQRRIAAVLGALDDKIELNRKMNRTLEAMAQALFKSWFIDFDGVPDSDLVESELGPIPKGWRVEPLGASIALAYGKSLPSKARAPGPVPVYGSGGISGYHNESLVAGPGIIVGRKGSVGTVYWEDGPFYPIDTTFFVVPQRGPSWLGWVFLQLLRMDIQRLGADSAVPGVNRQALLGQKWVVPPDYEIVRFQDFLAAIRAKLTANEQQSRTLATLRDTLLPKLISGEVRVPEAETAVEAVL